MNLSLRTSYSKCQVNYGAAHNATYRPAFSLSHFTVAHLRETQSHGLSVHELWSFIRPCGQSESLLQSSRLPGPQTLTQNTWGVLTCTGDSWEGNESDVLEQKDANNTEAEMLCWFYLWSGDTARMFLGRLFLSWDLGTVSLMNSVYSLLRRWFITVSICSNRQWTQKSAPQFCIQWGCSSI